MLFLQDIFDSLNINIDLKSNKDGSKDINLNIKSKAKPSTELEKKLLKNRSKLALNAENNAEE